MSTEEFIERYVIEHGFLGDEEREKERIQFLAHMHRELQKICGACKSESNDIRLRTIASFENLNSRIVGALYDAGYKSVGDLEGVDIKELEAVPGLAAVGIWQLINQLSPHGVVFMNHKITIK